MFENLFSGLQASNANQSAMSRRRFARRREDQCVAIIDDGAFPVLDWSMGGLLIRGDVRGFGMNEIRDITLRYKLRDEVVDIPVRGNVARKTADKIAFEFAPLTRQTRGAFQNVIDDYVTSRFADSHRESA